MTVRARAALAALAALYLLASRAYFVGLFNDDAMYVLAARSLLEGRLAFLAAVDEPPLAHWPPGFPLLLAPVALLSGDRLWPFQLVSVAASAASVWLFLRLFSGELASRTLACAAALWALSPKTVSLSGAVLSEPAYLAASLAVLLQARRVWDSGPGRSWLVLGALAGGAYLLRSSGAVLILALAAALAVEKRHEEALGLLGGAALVAAPALLRNRLAAGYMDPKHWLLVRPYLGVDGDWSPLALLRDNAGFYLREAFARDLLRLPAGLSGWPEAAAAAAGLLVAGWGAARWGAGGWRKAPLLYGALHCVLIVVWYTPGTRYLHPVLPLLAVLASLGAEGLARRLRLEGLGAPLLLGASLLLSAPTLAGLLDASVFRRTPLNSPPERTYAWIRENTGPEDVFATYMDSRLRLHTGRRSVTRMASHRGRPLAWLADPRVDWVLMSSAAVSRRGLPGESARDVLASDEVAAALRDRALFREAFSDAREGLTVYRVERGRRRGENDTMAPARPPRP